VINDREETIGKFHYTFCSKELTPYIAASSDGECGDERGGAAAANEGGEDTGKFYIYIYFVVHNQHILLQFHPTVNASMSVVILQRRTKRRKMQVSFVIYIIVHNQRI